ncbi:MAG TPA: hypothetical protein VIY52_25655 [Streptosporangiaceae bacterium]
MSTIEDRLRNAYQCATQTVRPESLRPPVLPQDEPAPPARRGRGRLGLPAFRGGLRPLAPLAAAAAVVVVAVAAITVPRLFPAAPPAASPFGPVVGGMSSPSPFLVVVRPPGIQVVSAATGRIVTQLPPPGTRTQWSQAAAGPGGRQFLLAATDEYNACRSLQFYALTLSGTGTVAGLRPYSAPQTGLFLGSNLNFGAGGLAVSADGSTVAYVTTNCASPGASQETITVIRHGTTRTWTSSVQANPAGLSLSADGSLLGYADLTNNSPARSPASAWILRTDSAPGPADQRARKVFTDQLNGGPQAQSTVLSPDGSTMYLLTAAFGARDTMLAYAVSAYNTATGARLRTLHTWHNHGYVMPPGFTANGDRALIWYLHGTSVDELNLVSGTATTYRELRVSDSPAVDIAW